MPEDYFTQKFMLLGHGLTTISGELSDWQYVMVHIIYFT